MAQKIPPPHTRQVPAVTLVIPSPVCCDLFVAVCGSDFAAVKSRELLFWGSTCAPLSGSPPGGPKAIRAACFTNDGSFFAISDDARQLWLFATAKLPWQIVGYRQVPKRVVELCPTGDEVLIAADKHGDVWEYRISDTLGCASASFSVKEKPRESASDESVDATHNGARLLFGHVSMVTCARFVMETDNAAGTRALIATGDRDEKVRLTHYPDTFNIASFCLGHQSFVTRLALLPARTTDAYPLLISGGGDDYLCVWDVENAAVLSKLPLKNHTRFPGVYTHGTKESPLGPQKLAVRSLAATWTRDGRAIVAAVVEDSPQLAVFVSDTTGKSEWQSVEGPMVQRQSESELCTQITELLDVAFSKDGTHMWVGASAPSASNLTVYEWSIIGRTTTVFHGEPANLLLALTRCSPIVLGLCCGSSGVDGNEKLVSSTLLRYSTLRKYETETIEDDQDDDADAVENEIENGSVSDRVHGTGNGDARVARRGAPVLVIKKPKSGSNQGEGGEKKEET